MKKPLLKTWWLPLSLAAVAAALPWIVRSLIFPSFGLVPGLKILDWYYTPPAILLGEELFPSGQFGTYPESHLSVSIAAILYGCSGLILGLLVPRHPPKSDADKVL